MYFLGDGRGRHMSIIQEMIARPYLQVEMQAWLQGRQGWLPHREDLLLNSSGSDPPQQPDHNRAYSAPLQSKHLKNGVIKKSSKVVILLLAVVLADGRTVDWKNGASADEQVGPSRRCSAMCRSPAPLCRRSSRQISRGAKGLARNNFRTPDLGGN